LTLSPDEVKGEFNLPLQVTPMRSRRCPLAQFGDGKVILGH